IASVKFLLAPFDAERNHLNFGEAFAVTTIGGAIGIILFYYAGKKITHWWRKMLAVLRALFTGKSVFKAQPRKRKNITSGRRFIVRVKKRFGLIGVAFVTPSIISIPFGAMVAAQFFRKRKAVLVYLLVSLVFWSLILNGIAQYLQLSQYIPH
ncbi:MAG TPA: hypothetical protein VI731_06370, partial [Bacteroidia bacterium]|nr:hypothetical protein [Bacteroidia bacterium]